MAKKSSALPVIAGGAALLAIASSKPKKKSSSSEAIKWGKTRWGVRVSEDCASVEIVNMGDFQKIIRGGYEELISIDPDLDVFQVADAIFGEVAPGCSGFPEEPASAEIAELFAFIVRAIGMTYIADPRTEYSSSDLYDALSDTSFIEWYRAWRDAPSAKLYEFPPNQIAFSSDYSTYKIGPDWRAETLMPFVQRKVEDEMYGQLLEDFVSSHQVMVGRRIVPISELPLDEGSVAMFVEDLESQLESALEETLG